MESRRLALFSTAGVLALAYCWWASALSSFTTAAYVAVAIPLVVLGAPYVAFGSKATRSRSKGAAWWPFAAVLFVAVVLEVIALALGGKAAPFPTLSTVVDVSLRSHAGRLLVYLAWMAILAVPLALGRLRPTRAQEEET